jgi:hypothetical protein
MEFAEAKFKVENAHLKAKTKKPPSAARATEGGLLLDFL